MIKVGIMCNYTLIMKSISAVVNSFDNISVDVEIDNFSVTERRLRDLHILVIFAYDTTTETSRIYNTIFQKFPELKILVISSAKSHEGIYNAISAGVHGIFTKENNPSNLEKALLQLYQTGFYLDSNVGPMVHHLLRRKNEANPFSTLTQKEHMIVNLVCGGFESREIADKLAVNIRTIESYRQKILEKTGVRNFTNVVLLAIKHRQVSTDILLSRHVPN